MTTERLLHVIALVSAWARADAEAVEVLLLSAEPDLVADLLEFTVMVLIQNTEGHPVPYLKWLGDQALALQANEAKP